MADDKKYFAFEGGGGKGAAFLAVAQALEALSDPLKGINAYDKISGFSGSSAGAITAVMLALETRSDVLEFLTSTGKFQKMFPETSPCTPDFRPFWRGFFQTSVSGSGDTRKSVFNYSKIFVPSATHEKYKELHGWITLEKVEDTLLNIASALPIPGNFHLAALIDKKNLISGFIHDKLNSPFKDMKDGDLLLPGNICNLITTGGLYPGEEVLYFSMYLSWLVKRFGKLNTLTKKDVYGLDTFGNTVLWLQKTYLGERNITRYTINPYGYLKDKVSDPAPSTGSLPNPYLARHVTARDKTRVDMVRIDETVLDGDLWSYRIGDGVMLTFKELADITKKELVLTSVNLLDGVTYYFSEHTTPDFPVAVAIAMSMNLPAWSPIYIRYTSPSGMNYDGWYFDGGVNHNLPMRVFNTDWATYSDYYRSRDKANMGVTKHQFYGFKLDTDETMFLRHFPSALSVAGAVASLKLEQSTYNFHHVSDKVATLKTEGLSVLEFTPDSNIFPKTNELNRAEVLKKLEDWEF